jgi:hypothetical protein
MLQTSSNKERTDWSINSWSLVFPKFIDIADKQATGDMT